MADDIDDALCFLNYFAESTAQDADMFLPGVYRVRVVNRGHGGWVRLVFYQRSTTDAQALAQLLLLPDPESVFPLDDGWACEGIPANERFGLMLRR